ncbi:MAG: DUF167 domain-containing protein [Alphaproteobacteria bacterium]|nr:MAG: DUF167 domain-containing protein [Alphaproteobacteria bacterium]
MPSGYCSGPISRPYSVSITDTQQPAFLEARADGLLLRVRLTPKAGRDDLLRAEADADGKVWLKATVTAVPEKGKANAALAGLLSKKLRLPKSAIRLIAGEQSRLKTLHIAGAPEELMPALLARLADLGLSAP